MEEKMFVKLRGDISCSHAATGQQRTLSLSLPLAELLHLSCGH